MITGITPPDTGRVMTHEACRYPLGNGICSLVAFIGVPIRLICLLEAEAGVE